MAKKYIGEILDEIENVNKELDSMTIHAIHNTKRGQKLQDKYDDLRRQLKDAR